MLTRRLSFTLTNEGRPVAHKEFETDGNFPSEPTRRDVKPYAERFLDNHSREQNYHRDMAATELGLLVKDKSGRVLNQGSFPIKRERVKESSRGFWARITGIFKPARTRLVLAPEEREKHHATPKPT